MDDIVVVDSNDTEVIKLKEENEIKVGQPLKFKTADDLNNRIIEFLEWCKENTKPLTIERLCVFLDCTRQTLLNYSKKQEYFDTIRRIKQQIHAEKMENLLDPDRKNVNGLIFDLKNNHQMSDIVQHEHKDADLDKKLDSIENLKDDINKLSTSLKHRFLQK